MKIGILIPSYENVPALFAYNLAQLTAFTAGVMPEDTELGVTMVTSADMHAARADLMTHALEDGLDYALWVNADMTFPREALALLLSHKLPMVGVNYSTREIGGHPVAMKTTRPGEFLVTDSNSSGLAEVEGMGFGMVLMRMGDFTGLKDIPQPWFSHKWLDDERQFMSEDIVFCEMVREKLGHRLFIDQDLSQGCGHIGQFEFGLHHLEAIKGDDK